MSFCRPLRAFRLAQPAVSIDTPGRAQGVEAKLDAKGRAPGPDDLHQRSARAARAVQGAQGGGAAAAPAVAKRPVADGEGRGRRRECTSPLRGSRSASGRGAKAAAGAPPALPPPTDAAAVDANASAARRRAARPQPARAAQPAPAATIPAAPPAPRVNPFGAPRRCAAGHRRRPKGCRRRARCRAPARSGATRWRGCRGGVPTRAAAEIFSGCSSSTRRRRAAGGGAGERPSCAARRRAACVAGPALRDGVGQEVQYEDDRAKQVDENEAFLRQLLGDDAVPPPRDSEVTQLPKRPPKRPPWRRPLRRGAGAAAARVAGAGRGVERVST